MERNTLILGTLLLMVGIGTGYILWGNNPYPAGTHMMQSGSMMGQNIDQHFITQMIPHHEGAIAMAKVALERSKRPEMITLANGIIAAQEKEINDMQSWYQSWFGSTVPENSVGMMHMDGMTGDLDVLKKTSAADFDREFITQMIPHHEMAVMMAQMLQASTGRAEMKQLASNIIASQSSEIALMRGWLKSW
jgi:uncharacterized protein (DUF305 family)